MTRGRRSRKSGGETWPLVSLVCLMAVGAVVQMVHDHPGVATLVAVASLGTAATWVYLRMARTRRLAKYERNIAVTDHMSGPEFEQYVARLMRASGCRRVEVCGGRGDMGADVIGYTPDGRRLVVQCKRYTGRLGSPEVQRFAGTARDIHGADVALLVTTGRPTGQAWEVARRCRITMADRAALARWASTYVPPIEAWHAAAPPESVSQPPSETTGGAATGVDWWSSPQAP